MSTPEPKKILPPYVSHISFTRFLDTLRGDDHLPDQIDRGVLHNLSGSGISAMLKTLEALALIDGSGKPTKALRGLLAHPRESGEYKAQFKAILEKAYPYLFNGSVNLKTATTNQVQTVFREQEVSGSTVSKCIAFFLAAAKEAGIEVSKYVRVPPMAETTTRKRSTTVMRASVNADDYDDGESLELVSDLHPALLGVLQTLPAPGQAMSAKERTRFLKAFEAVLSLAHPAQEDEVG